jgi:flagellar assembly factor FliW
MPQAQTKHFGAIQYDEEAVLTFPEGLPAFEQLTRFLLIDHPSATPLVFLQSLERSDLSLPAIAALAVDPDYELSLSVEDLETLAFSGSEGAPPENAIGCFAIVSIPDGGPPSANLLAPIVVNLAARRAVQSVRSDGRYSHQCPILPAGEGVCS